MRMTPTDGPSQLDAAHGRLEVCVVITVHLDDDGRPVGRAHAERPDAGHAHAERPDAGSPDAGSPNPGSTEPFTFEGWLSLMAGLARLLAEQKES
jgi:hypothetical protein